MDSVGEIVTSIGFKSHQANGFMIGGGANDAFQLGEWEDFPISDRRMEILIGEESMEEERKRLESDFDG